MPSQYALTDYYVRLRRTLDVDAAPEYEYTAIKTVDLGQSRLLRLLAPSSVRIWRWNREITSLERPPLRLTDVRRFEAMILGDEPWRGITLGAIARLWSVRPSMQRVPPEFFNEIQRPGFVKITASIEGEHLPGERTRAVIDVRFQPIDRVALRQFRLGWSFGRLITTVIQREVLILIARRAEHLASLAANNQ